MKKELRQANATGRPAHRHHNNPPSEAVIQDQQGISSSVTLIWDQLERLETEIEKPEPSLPKLKAIANALWEISVKIAAFCGSLANVALKESAKTVGGTGTKAAIGVLATTTAAQNEGVKAVVRAVWEFVKTLP